LKNFRMGVFLKFSVVKVEVGKRCILVVGKIVLLMFDNHFRRILEWLCF